MWTFIKTHLLKLQDQHVPSKQSSTRYSQSWINREVKRLSRKKKRSFDKARRTGNAKDLRRYKHLKQLSTEACRWANNSYITNIISPDSTENPKNSGVLSRDYELKILELLPWRTAQEWHNQTVVRRRTFWIANSHQYLTIARTSNVTQFQTRVPVHLMICQPSQLDWRESIRYSTDFKFTRQQGQTKYLAIF